MNTLHNLFLNELSDCHDAELRISKTLSRLADAATSDDLSCAFQRYLKITESHVQKLDTVFECFDRKARWKTCEPMMGILREGEDMAAAFKGSPAIRAVMLVAVQRAVHYKMATYGCLQEWALRLGNPEASVWLHELFQEEEIASTAFTVLAGTLSLEHDPARPVMPVARRSGRGSAARLA